MGSPSSRRRARTMGSLVGTAIWRARLLSSSCSRRAEWRSCDSAIPCEKGSVSSSICPSGSLACCCTSCWPCFSRVPAKPPRPVSNRNSLSNFQRINCGALRTEVNPALLAIARGQLHCADHCCLEASRSFFLFFFLAMEEGKKSAPLCPTIVPPAGLKIPQLSPTPLVMQLLQLTFLPHITYP